MNEVNRGFEGILLACSRDMDPIFFDCPPHSFPSNDGTYTIYEIKNGVLNKETSDIPIETPSIEYKRIVEIEDRVISGSFDESMTNQLYYFNDHVAQLASNYFCTIVIHIKLVFGINEDALENNSDDNSRSEEEENNIFVLLDGSTVITLNQQINAQVVHPEISSLVEKVMTSNKNYVIQESISNQNEKQESAVVKSNKSKNRNKSYYASDSLSFNESEDELNKDKIENQTKNDDYNSGYSNKDFLEHYNPDSQIIEAIDAEINKKIDHNFCVTNSPECGPPKYQISRIIVALFNLDTKFPYIGDSELYYQLKLRIHHINEKVPCCVQCYHIYMAAERVCRACKKSSALTFELSPQPFQPLVANELKRRGKMPLNSTIIQKNDPHSFFLNIVQSPYKDPVFLIPEPQKLGTKKKSVINMKKKGHYSSNSRASSSYSSNKREPTPNWVSRLAGDDPDAASSFSNSRKGTRYLCMSSFMKYRAANMNDLPYYLPPVGYSEALAPNNYNRPPFDISKLNPKRKRKLHVLQKKNNEDV